MKHFTKFYYFASLLICFLFSGQYSYADGSKDLYSSGSGGRAKLRSSTVTSTSYPFANLNTHYVYAVAGETITLASSVMGIGSSRIKLTKPNGTMTSYSSGGLIANRNQEVAGPRLPNVVGGNYYTPITYTVQPGETGIFSVDFVPPAGETANSQDGREGTGVLFTANWTAQGASDIMISAWDVSIYDSGNTFIPGRVYATVLNLDINSSFSAASTYYGKMYVLTKDGYTYKVDNNGNNGISFEFFVNSNGFVNGAGEPIYKSLNTTTGISSQIKDPRTADNTTSVTHKMFYTLPANDLPASASGAVAGGTGTTWLKNPRLVPEVSDLKLFGVEGTEGQVSHKGGNIKFSANLSGRYIIEISAVAPANFPTRTITGFASVGLNSVNWDGKDGLGNPLPSGNSPAKLTIRLQGAEVHFPYFDMEINPNGIKLELLNAGLNAVESDIVYWNDTDITLTSGVNNPPSNPINASQSAIPAGTSSNTNGHKWGSNSSPTSGTFGDNKSMDTWTFVLGAEETLNTVISTKVADLKVNSITPNVSTVGANGNITYTVEVQNSDGSAAYNDVTNAPFSFNVPAGMEIVSAVYVSACGTETNGAISADKLHYNAQLNLTNGCKGTYTIVTKAVGVSSGNVMVEATIMRPNDVNDPDATNPDPNVLPTDPHLECKNGTATESCNNIKYNNVVTVINKITAVKSIAGNPVTVKPGDVLTYNIILTNTDALPKTGVTASDVVPSTLTGITAINNGGVATGNTINWTGLTVPANGSLTLSFNATVVANLPVGTTSIKNVASIIDPIDPTTPVAPEVEKPTEGKITAVKTIAGNPATVKPGDVLTYNITLSNSFGTAKTGVTASDVVPSTLTGITAISNSGTLTGNTINWAGLTVPANGSLTLSFNATVAANLPIGTTSIKNTASIVDPIDPTVPVTPEVEKPTEGKITAVKTIAGNPATVKPGDVLTYNITLTNSFGTAKTGVTASDIVPSTLTGITAISNGGVATGNTINWAGLTVPANGSLTLSFNATVVANLPVGTTSIKNTASIVDPIDPTVPVTPEVEKPTEGKITAVKTIAGNPATVKPGDVLTYNITLTNSFGTAKTGVTASDVVPSTLTGITAINNGGVATGNTINWAGLTVPANGSLTLSFNATVAANLPIGTTSIKNTASIVDPIDPTVPVTPEVEKPTEGKITAVKMIAGNPATVKPGDVLTYNIVLTNSFGTAKTGVTASDNVPSTLTGIAAISNSGTLTGNKIDWTGLTVPANGSLTLSFNATVVANLPVGTTSIKNVASIIDPIDPTTPVAPEVEKPTEGKITAVKTIAGNPATVKPGDVLTYNITLTNSFGTAKTGVTASDVVPSTLTGITAISNAGTLTGNKIDWTGLTIPANGSLTLSFNATVAANLPAGTTSIKNVASIVDPIDPTVPVAPEVEKPTEGKITAVKTIAGNPTTVKPGDVLTYNIVLTNSFGTAKTGVTASDNVPSTLTGITAISNAGTLTGNTINWAGLTVPANGSLTLSFNATVVANLPVGTTSIKNVASIIDPIDPTTPVAPEVEKPTEGKITAVKTIAGNPATVKPGDILTYNITLTNSFGTAKTGVTASDNVPSTLTGITAISNAGTLTGNTINWAGLTVPANGSLTLSFNATVAANLPAGTASIKNVASIVDPIDPTVPVAPEVEKPTEGKITAVKTIVGNPATVKPGDVLTYNIILTNSFGTAKTGVTASDNVPSTLTGITAISNAGTLTGNKIDWTGLTVPANGSLTLSFKAIVSGNLPVGTISIKNTASIVDPIDPAVPIIPEIELPVNESPAINLVKTVTNTGTGVGGAFNVGDKIEYTFTIKNTGDVTLYNINITDPLISNSAINIPGSILPNNEVKQVVNYTVTQADADAGNVTNSALAKASSPAGNIIEDKSGTTIAGDDPTITPITQNPSLSLTKTAVVGVHNKIGDVINYNLVVKNTGNVTLTAIAITDANADAGSISPALVASLAPNATANITAKHTVTQADLDRGYVANIAKADGKNPKGGNVHAESTDPAPIPGAPVDPTCTTCTITPIQQSPAIKLTKTAVAGPYNKVGDIINYNLVLENTGNVTITKITISDANADAGSITPATIATLAPNATISIKAKHTVTQSDLDKGYVSNLAKADGEDPNGGKVNVESTDPAPIPGAPVDPGCPKCTITPVEQKGAVALVKTVTNAGTGENGAFVLGNQIEYTFTVTNTGNVSLKDLILSDPLLNKLNITIPGVILPGQSVSHVEKYTITAADVVAGKVTNQAVIKATDPKGGNVTDQSGTAANNDNPTVITIAKPPVVKDDTKETQQNKPVVIDVQSNDEPGSSAIVPGSTTIITQPKNGTIKVNSDGTITYTPNQGYTGTDEFTYTVTDKNGQVSNPAKVTLTVVPTKPVAIDDAAETQWNTEVKIPLLGNDKTDGAAFDKGTVEITAQPKHGTIKVNPDGTVTYLPNSGYTGTDTFKYRVKDEYGNWTDVATVTLNVKGFFIPNVITPNGDGKNDTFLIVGLENFGNADVTVFNRWGNEVYRNNNYKNTWTGEGLNEGTYYYLIRLNNNGKQEVYKGWVLIKR
uniref:DUF7507 domain-containing protein n=1 Tax=Pedobacter schmidteae TaxID=2201271 RepID=UPI000EB21620|nr:Ig-like domain-containing protein [Pedobacter schmidteae]